MIKNIEHTKKLIVEGLRTNKRKLDEFREVKIETNVMKNAEGSAKVTIGDTTVIVGVKIGVGTPFPDTPDEGILIINAELAPIASPEFESGPPKPMSIEIARVVDRGIRESHCVEFDKLCITPGEEVYMVNIDIQVLDHDGNLLDAAGLGAIAALLTAKIPEFKDGRVNIEKSTGKLPVVDKPIPITIGKIGDKLLVDMDAEEEDALEARITISSNKNKDLCAMQKGGEGFFTSEELKQAVDLSIKKGQELRKLL